MDFLNYTCFVEGLAADSSKVDFNARLLTSILGLAGEAAECVEVVQAHVIHGDELDRTKLIDECSDLMWYMAFATTTLEVSLQEMIEKAAKEEITFPLEADFPLYMLTTVMDVSCTAGKCADITKKYLFHSKPFDKDKLMGELNDLMGHITCTAKILGLTIQDVVDVNVAKLKDRYKTGKFTFEEFMQKETAKGDS